MSTILETLKKLEEEKRILDRDVDLKSLVLQGESPAAFSQKLLPGKVGMVLGLVFGGVFLGWVLFSVFNKNEPSKSSRTSLAAKPAQVSSDEVLASREVAHSGIPLSNISEIDSEGVSSEPQRSFFAEDMEAVVESVPAVTPEYPEAFELPPEIAEIGNLITSARELAMQPDSVSARSVSRIRRGDIPGMKVKGIIYFGDNSSSNHIFVSTPNKSNLKMKIGDVALGAALQSVESNKVVFSYQNKLIEIGIGE